MRTWFMVGCGMCALGVVLGAFGAHGLKGSLTVEQMAIYDTAGRYHLFGALSMVLAAMASDQKWPALLMLCGILFFCGSLYALALGGPRWLGAVTPLGGTSFILGWIFLAVFRK